MQRTTEKTLCVCLIFACTLLFSGCSFPGQLSKKSEATLPAKYIHIDGADYSKAVAGLIKSAKKCVYVEQNWFDSQEYMNLLVERAKQGVEVKVLLDISVRANKDTYAYLRANGVSVQYYPTEKGQSARCKLLAVDNAKAIIGGNDWYPAAAQYHDTALELDGRSGRWAARIFSRDWAKATTNDLNVPAETELPDDNILLATDEKIKPIVSRQIQSSKKSIQVELTQLADTELLSLLLDAAASGKQVRIILDQNSQRINQPAIDKLKSAGALVKNYPATDSVRLNSRFAIFDGSTALIGTANWTHSAFIQNHEIAVLVPSTAVAQRLSTQFNEDWKKSLDTGKSKA